MDAPFFPQTVQNAINFSTSLPTLAISVFCFAFYISHSNRCEIEGAFLLKDTKSSCQKYSKVNTSNKILEVRK